MNHHMTVFRVVFRVGYRGYRNLAEMHQIENVVLLLSASI